MILENNKEKIKVRFAPSPTGDPHVGGIRTALFNWLLARKEKGQFILRIEDTDQERYQADSVENIKKSLEWLGLNWDEGPYFQSKRTEKYQQAAQELISKEKAYYCFCSKQRLEKLRIRQAENKKPPKYDKHCLKLSPDEIKEKINQGEKYVIRLKIPEKGTTEFKDSIRGRVKFENQVLDDTILLKSDGFPTYHLANVIDDHDMGITHVIRAEEWLPSTPKHILLYQALGFEPPWFAHLPLILGRDNKKLSKRHGSVSILQYKEDGYLPAAILNFLAFLGWNPKTEKEFFSRSELIEAFSLNGVNKSGAIFNLDKLNWLNGYYIRQMDPQELKRVGEPFLKKEFKQIANEKNIDLVKLWEMSADRINTLKEINKLCDFVFEPKDYLPEILIPRKSNKTQAIKNLKLVESKLKDLSEKDFKADYLRDLFLNYIKENNLNTGELLWPFRVALSGKRASPDVFDMSELLGKELVLKKIDMAMDKLNIL
ncbi:MAG: glutamate--tRNA ligase [Patescibacteria group bacterium]|nr:glutamate--tRNA ligase [Patescibacteria group bacterium]